MRHLWVNIALLVLLVVQLATGLAALGNGAERGRWVVWLHGIAGYAVALALFWKGRVIFASVRRHRRRLGVARWAFLGMTVLLGLVLGTGFAWSYFGFRTVGGFTLMVVHGSLAAGLALPLGWHLLARRWVLRVPKARDRRAFLRLAGVTLAGLAAWQVAKPAQSAWALPGARRRFTGSYETGSATGRFPEVSWLWDAPRRIEAGAWELRIVGAVATPLTLGYEEVLALATDEVMATVDCTGGWFSEQVWRGVALSRLLALAEPTAAARSVTVEGVTGYGRRFPLRGTEPFLLATGVAGEALSHGHGAPLRLVAPGRRGYDWVKWVVRLHVNETSEWWQPPLPTQ